MRSSPEPGDRVGAFLRGWREQRGWTIDQVAWVLRIRLVYLDALEEDRFEELPGQIYVTGFVRSYAKLLGIDGEAAVRQLRSQYPEVDRRNALVFPEPPAERAVPGGALTAVGIMAAIMIYGGWYYQTATSHSDRAFIDSVPSRLIATAELSDESGTSGERAGNALPATVPMQPPMRPPPTQTVAAAPSVQMEPVRRPEGTPAPAAAPPTSVSVPRGDPPEAGAALPVQVALANAGRSASELGRNGDRAAARSGQPDRGSGDYAAADGRRGRAPALGAPQLPTAEMADAYAATLPAGMIPDMRNGISGVPQTTPSASAAWAGSVDGMQGGQWGPPGLDRQAASGPVILNAVEATWIEVREKSGQVVTGKLLQPGDSYTVPQKDGLKLTTGNAGGLQILVGGRQAPRVGPRGAVRRDIDLDGRQLLAGQPAAN